MSKVQIHILSGLDTKGPAAILLSQGGSNILLDAGDGPEEDRLLDTRSLPPLDAVILTHNHEDHINALRRFDPRCPVFATQPVAAHLPSGLDIRLLPCQGEARIPGLKVTTGANGHSPGGVWLHIAPEHSDETLLYTGDFSRESESIPFDAPPLASHVLADASYGLYDAGLDGRKAELLELIAPLRQCLLPLPLSGRAADILLALESTFPAQWSIEPVLREDILCHARLTKSEKLESLAGSAGDFDPQARILLTGDPHAHQGAGALVAADWLKRRPEGCQIVFTGHVIATSAPLIESGLARFARWNVHPRSSDLRWLAAHCKPRSMTPLFTPLAGIDWHGAFGAIFNDKPDISLS